MFHMPSLENCTCTHVALCLECGVAWVQISPKVENNSLGCVVLPCFVVCMMLLATPGACAQCLCMVVDAAGKKACTNLELQLNNLLSTLFQHVSPRSNHIYTLYTYVYTCMYMYIVHVLYPMLLHCIIHVYVHVQCTCIHTCTCTMYWYMLYTSARTCTYYIVCPCQACVPVDMTSSTSIKNHNEILRCFAVTSKCRDNVTSVYMYCTCIHGTLCKKNHAVCTTRRLASLAIIIYTCTCTLWWMYMYTCTCTCLCQQVKYKYMYTVYTRT